MYQENEFDKLEEIRTAVAGLNSVRNMLEIVDLSRDNISYNELAGLIAALAFTINCRVDQILAILHSTESL